MLDTRDADCVRSVDVDIQPGDGPNSINLGKKGVIPVAILTTATLDASRVDPATAVFEGARVATNPKGTLLAALADVDVDADGDLDLVVHFRKQGTDLEATETEGCLTGETFSGIPIAGCDSVRIVL